ncbi:MAG: TonB-dependent receptor [Chitinophagaceae bacterium]
MKSLFIIITFMVIASATQAQLSGRVVSTDSTALAFANISLLKPADSSFVKAALTNEQGTYSFTDIPAGEYLLSITHTGYQVFYSTIVSVDASQPIKDLGTQILQQQKKQLDEVVVRARRPLMQQKPEGMVVNVENSLLSKGSSALQVLSRMPGVVINYRDNSIALNGKNGVMVMINGKLLRMPIEQLVNWLNNMSADDIASIELLTTPPAKYDAEGSAGLINIVLKKNRKLGTSGNLSLTAGYGKGEKATANASFAHNTQKLNLYGSYTYSRNKTYTWMHVLSAQHMDFLGGDVITDGDFNTNALSNNHNATIGLDVKANNKTTIGGSFSYNKILLSGATITNAGYNVLPDSLIEFNGNNHGHNSWNNIITNIYLDKNIREGEKLSISADYLRFNNAADYNVESSFINNKGMQAGDNQVLFSPAQQGTANTLITVGVGKIDYAASLSKNVKLETGLKGAYTTSGSLSAIQSLLNGAWITTDQTSNYIKMKEGIGAAYASVNAQLSPSLSVTAGLRYEYSATRMNNFKTGDAIINRKMGALFPSLFISKKINDNQEWQFSYTKRISRPSYNDLASFVGYSDPTAVYTGNPFLQPTITHNFKLGYSYKGYSFSLLASRDIHPIARYQLSESPEKNILYISPQNMEWQNNLTLQATLPVTVNNWWNMSYSLVGGPRQYKDAFAKTPFEKTWWGYSFNYSEVFKLPKSFSIEVSGWYNGTSYNGTQRVKAFGVLNTGIKKDLKNNGGSLQLSVSDILMQERYDIRYGTIVPEAYDIVSHVVVNTESTRFPIFKLTWSKSFGGGIKERKQNNSSLDEKERVRN